MAERGIPAHTMGRVLGANSGLRVSDGGKQALKRHLEGLAEEIALRSLVYMRHARRRTVTLEDVELALTDILGGSKGELH